MSPRPSATDIVAADDTGGAAAELRLALVCYGGVSLAVYMHGITKELYALVAASRAFDAWQPGDPDPDFAEDDTRRAYFSTLRDLDEAGMRTAVVVDIIAGTSAGGINGVCLAQGLSCHGSQEQLKQLWIREGDLTKLLRFGRLGGWRARTLWSGLRTVLRAEDPVSPLRGDRMSQLLYDAIAAMAEPLAEPNTPLDGRHSLLDPDTTLELFITTTDLDGFPVLMPTGGGGVSQAETNNAQVLCFRSDEDGFGPAQVGALAFAARATASFPGAFPPVSVRSFGADLQSRPYAAGTVAAHFLNRYSYTDRSGGVRTSDDAWFVDGGVLDNAPFDHVIDAIATKSAQSQVIRRLVYIEPDPGRRLADAEAAAPTAHGAPGYLASTFRAVFGVRSNHSILGDLERLRDMNLRILEIGAITDRQYEQVADEVEKAFGPTTWQISDVQEATQLAAALHDAVPKFVGAYYPTYCRLKVDQAGRRLADSIAECYQWPPNASRSSFVRAAIAAWAREQRQWSSADPSELANLLADVDIPYRERRYLFTLSGINDLYGDLSGDIGRADLDALKAAAWALVADLRRIPEAAVTSLRAGDALRFLDQDALPDDALFDDPRTFAAEHSADFDQLFAAYREQLRSRLIDHSRPIWPAFAAHTGRWSADHRKVLLTRFLGFPLWDCLIFPTVALSNLPQFTPITVSQFSPLTAQVIPPPTDGKLKGVSLHHFGGFTDAAWRENDYLWGRLDAVELILRMLRTAHGPAPGPVASKAEAAAQAGPHLISGLRAVLDSERGLSVWGSINRCVREAIDGP